MNIKYEEHFWDFDPFVLGASFSKNILDHPGVTVVIDHSVVKIKHHQNRHVSPVFTWKEKKQKKKFQRTWEVVTPFLVI